VALKRGMRWWDSKYDEREDRGAAFRISASSLPWFYHAHSKFWAGYKMLLLIPMLGSIPALLGNLENSNITILWMRK
jgi:hypothetical protein